MRVRHSVLFLCLGAPASVVAQFAGGSANGFSAAAVNGIGLDGSPTPPWPVVSAPGGPGDGFVAATVESVGLDGLANPVWPVVLPAGDSGDGFSAAAIESIGLDGSANPPWPVVSQTGGSGDGFSAAVVKSYGLDGTANPTWSMFSLFGGSGDGFSAAARESIGLDGFSNPPWTGVPVTGGIGDGHSALSPASFQFTFRFGSAATYTQWQSSLFTMTEIAEGQTTPLADFEGDGITNVLEYALGLNPRESYTGGLPYAEINDLTPYGLPASGQDFFSLVVPRSPFALDALLSPEISADLSLWTDEVIVVRDTPALLIVRDTAPVNMHSRRLWRLRVTLP